MATSPEIGFHQIGFHPISVTLVDSMNRFLFCHFVRKLEEAFQGYSKTNCASGWQVGT
jgi:hypothetical protein